MSSKSGLTREEKLVMIAFVVSIVWLLAVWLIQGPPLKIGEQGRYAFQYDRVTPIVDGMLGLLLTVSGVLLWRRNQWGRRLALIGAVYLIFLGIMDLTVPIGEETYAISIVDAKRSGFVNLWCIVLGLYIIIHFRQPPKSGPA
jgi:threonine/homoserine/homoserine lactone efflux protein